MNNSNEMALTASTIAKFPNKKIGESFERELFGYLSVTTCFNKFKNRITSVMNNMGFNDWTYSNLELPKQICIEQHLGTFDSKTFHQIQGEGLLEWDMMLDCARQSAKALFQSELEHQFSSLRFRNERIENYLKLIATQKQLGYHDTYCIPQSSLFTGTFLFCTTSKGTDPKTFRQNVYNKRDKLRILGKVIDKVGTTNFPSLFVETRQYYHKLTASLPFVFLVTMSQNDLSISETAEHCNISIEDAHKALSTIRAEFHANTNTGAYNEIVKAGYFSS